ncbi:MAG TPA: carboxypeptidase regulatory-like domain-containing protein [Thermoplasmatales archaeon]|nr:carboxypeptidase regulatory-like domain-containing protein [Thermoplasmatales archaeon]
MVREMGCKEIISGNRLDKRLLSFVVVVILLFTSFMAMIQTIGATPGYDSIKTYMGGDGLIESTVFGDEEFIIVNVTVDGVTGDPPGPLYSIKAINENTGEWVNVIVSDNDTQGPWGVNNIAGDGTYWGAFQINSTHITYNSSGPGEQSILQVSNGDIINITEEYPGPFDGDTDIAYTIVTVDFSGGSPSGNGTVCGFVKFDNGTPIVDATVHLIGSAEYFVNTDAIGYYIFYNNVSSGHYDSEVFKGSDPPVPGDSFDLSANQTFWLNFTILSSGGPPGGNGSNITLRGIKKIYTVIHFQMFLLIYRWMLHLILMRNPLVIQQRLMLLEDIYLI